MALAPGTLVLVVILVVDVNTRLHSVSSECCPFVIVVVEPLDGVMLMGHFLVCQRRKLYVRKCPTANCPPPHNISDAELLRSRCSTA